MKQIGVIVILIHHCLRIENWHSPSTVRLMYHLHRTIDCSSSPVTSFSYDMICVAQLIEFIVACDLKNRRSPSAVTDAAVHDREGSSSPVTWKIDVVLQLSSQLRCMIERASLSLPPWKLTVTWCPGHKIPWSYKPRAGLTTCSSSKQRESNFRWEDGQFSFFQPKFHDLFILKMRNNYKSDNQTSNKIGNFY